jgi:hypothetical protein
MFELRRLGGHRGAPEEDQALILCCNQLGLGDAGLHRDVDQRSPAVAEGQRPGQGRGQRALGVVDAAEDAVVDLVMGEQQRVVGRALRPAHLPPDEVFRTA